MSVHDANLLSQTCSQTFKRKICIHDNLVIIFFSITILHVYARMHTIAIKSLKQGVEMFARATANNIDHVHASMLSNEMILNRNLKCISYSV